MYIKQLAIENFRNIEKANIEPHKGVNLIYGDNAQGKTNIIENIWLYTGCKSFRNVKDNDLIRFDCEYARSRIDFRGDNWEKQIEFVVCENRQYRLNGIVGYKPSTIMGEFSCVIFSPSHLALIKQGPSERRKYLDIAISQLKPKYTENIKNYYKLLKQRNAVLKEINRNKNLIPVLDVYEEKLAFEASEIVKYRTSYLKKLCIETEKIYRGISDNTEEMSMEYICFNMRNFGNTPEEYAKKLKETRKTDALTGQTSVGPHRDDLEININGFSAKRFGSQGQQRSCALAMKLGEANMINNVLNENPVVLLDDVMSELDYNRQDFVLNHIKNWQVFITCCDKYTLENLDEGRAFHIENGKFV